MTHQQDPAHCGSQHTTAPYRIALASALLVAGSANATVGAPLTAEANGLMGDIAYGAGGNIFELEPLLSVLGLSPAGNAKSVADKNSALQFSYLVSGEGTSLMTIDYRLRNISSNQSFSQLRFAVFANPDGAPDFADVLSETWDPAAKADPALREGRAFLNAGIKADFVINNNLSEGVQALDADCRSVTGCDATVGLQWNADTLAPGETFHVRLGLSDNGQSLSGRFLTISAVSDPGTVLTFSGQGAIVPVPEPGAAWMLAAGLAGLGWLARRRAAG